MPIPKSVKMADGSTALVDEATAAYLKSKSPQPTQSALASVLAIVRSIRIVRGGSADGEPLGSDVLAEVIDQVAVDTFRSASQVVDGGSGHCMCHGDPTIVLLGEDGRRLAVMGVHHGARSLWSAWRDDAKLVDGGRLTIAGAPAADLAAGTLNSVLRESGLKP